MRSKYEIKITDIREKIAKLLENITQANKIAYDAYKDNDTIKFQEVQDKLNNLGFNADMIDNEIIKAFALFGPEADELRSLIAYLKMTNEIVRIGMGIKKYARRMKEHIDSECDLEPLNPTILPLHKSTIASLELICECFVNFDECNIEDNYRKVMVEESKNDDLFSILEKDIMTNIIDEKELAIEYVKVLGSLRKLERSCDRTVNIANLMLYAKNGGEIHLHQ
ncbi:PhoU family transcriptional regulator [Sulfurimonas lithotrophica]|uniref:PhoU family transcriptional regulator n=1 Tax=Sulfurimonas lithotrophica TaxID=2590022 RepID=A0A5P8P343_9BACT|nr:PhoU domain-containing protein [Sulfurimonas lithotrophica]QFR50173.1 PhoU family transcriptional regulator [Sulfurimonas lithotrophica]